MHRSIFIDFTAELSSAEIWDVGAVFKVHPLDLPIPAEVKRTNLSDSFEQEEEEKIIVPVIFDEEVPMATSTSTQVGQVQQSTTIKEPHPPIQTSHSIQVLIQLHVVA